VRGQRHAPAAWPVEKTRYPLCRKLGGPQSRSGRVRKISPPTGIKSLDRPVRSESFIATELLRFPLLDKGVLLQARCGPEGSRRLRLPDFHDIQHMKVVRSSSRTVRHYPQEMFLVLIFTRGWVDSRAMVRSEGNMSLKNPVTPLGIDPGTVRLVAQRLNQYATPGPFCWINCT